MAFNSLPLLATGDWIDAAWGNTYWKDNFAALYPYTMAGDLAYGVSAGGSLARLGIGGAGALLYSGGSAPAWLGIGGAGALLYSGGSAPAWLGIGGAGALLYSGGSAPAWLGIGTVGQILMSTGTAPGWQSGERYIPIYLNSDVALATADWVGWFMIPPALNGWNITHVSAMRRSGTGTPEFQIRNDTDVVNVLSTRLTIDSGERTSLTAATPAVINTAVDDVASYDVFVIEVVSGGTNTLNCVLYIGFTKP